MASTYIIAANALEALLTATFPGVTVVHDKVHEAIGFKGPRIGIAPTREIPNARNKLMMEAWIEVRYMDVWDRKVDPAQKVDPRLIAAKAQTLMEAIQSTTVTASGSMWFFNVEMVNYPDDPTANKTRFYMTLRAWGNNASMVETTA